MHTAPAAAAAAHTLLISTHSQAASVGSLFAGIGANAVLPFWYAEHIMAEGRTIG